MKKKTSLLLILVLIMVLGPRLVYSQNQTQAFIYIPVGQQKTVPARNATDFWVTDQKICAYEGLRDAILLIGRSVGTTTMTIKYRDGRLEERFIKVITRDPRQVLSEIQELLGYIEGIEYKIIGDKVILDGTVLTYRDKARIDRVLEIYPNQVIDMFDEALEPMRIGVQVHFFEYSRSNIQEYDPGLPNASNPILSVEGSGGIGEGAGPFRGKWDVSLNILPRLAYYVEKEWAKVRHAQSVTVLDGDSAKILSGGEILYTVRTELGGMSQEWKEYGLQLGVKPTVLNSGRIQLDLRAVSSDVASLKGETPRIESDEMSTTEIVDNGATAILGGIVTEEKVSSRRKVPVLGEVLPFIFSKKNEWLVERNYFITVTVTSPPDFSMAEFPLEKEMENK